MGLLLLTKENPLALLGPAFLRFVRRRLRGKQALLGIYLYLSIGERKARKGWRELTRIYLRRASYVLPVGKRQTGKIT